MSYGAYMIDKDGRYLPAIPEPYWKASWRTLFRLRPFCCGHIFKSREEYDMHYVIEHIGEKEAQGD